MNTITRTLLLCSAWGVALAINSEALTNTDLVARVQQGDRDAIIEAGQTGDTNFVRILQGIARPHFVASINTNKLITNDPHEIEVYKNAMARPVYDDPAARNARMALAKLGVKEYLDEILLEATKPSESPVYKETKKYPAFAPSRYDALMIQSKAFEKLRYIKDRSTVKALMAMLSNQENPADYIIGGDTTFSPPSELAMEALSQIVDTPPSVNLPQDTETHDARVNIWRQWWEQNKDKYP